MIKKKQQQQHFEQIFILSSTLCGTNCAVGEFLSLNSILGNLLETMVACIESQFIVTSKLMFSSSLVLVGLV